MPAASQQALATFRAIDAALRDGAHGGYDESRSRPALDTAPKTMAAQLHALEALTQVRQHTLLWLLGDVVCAWALDLKPWFPGHRHRFAW